MTVQYQNASLLELFLLEAQAQTQLLDQALIGLSQHPTDKSLLESCMRAAHSLKGAARLVGVEPAVGVAHEMEELLVEAMRGQSQLNTEQIQLLMQGSSALMAIAEGKTPPDLALLVQALSQQALTPAQPAALPKEDVPSPLATTEAAEELHNHEEIRKSGTIRVSSERLDLLLDLASRSLVESKHAQRFGLELLRIKKIQLQAKSILEALRDQLVEQQMPDYFLASLTQMGQLLSDANTQTVQSLQHYDSVSWSTLLLNQNLYDAALACRMRPFSDLFTGKARMVFDLATRLNKKVQLQVEGEHTSVDRDMLERLEAPLLHLIRNAVDHGIEEVQERLSAGKTEIATIRLKAWHASGYLHMEISDDGRGVNLEKIKSRVLSRNLATAEAIAQMDEQELLAFLFLPDFSLAQQVSDISGRGVGLDAVQHEIKALGGHIELINTPGLGCNFQFRLPVTVSVIRCVIVEVSSEVYAIPLHRIESMLRLQQDELITVEGRPHFWWNGDAIGLLRLSQLLGLPEGQGDPQGLGVLVFQERDRKIAFAVEKLLGEQSLVVMHMDQRFGRLSAVMAGAVLADGTPALILDIDDVLTKASTLLKQGQVNSFTSQHQDTPTQKILVVDDSLTVRELERKLLSNKGYQVQVAVDGLEGWTMLRAEKFDLLVTDIDMPKMDGIELVRLVRADPRLNRLPVIVVSYKDREEDKNKGLEAGADYYLAKSSFHDESLIEAVQILIGAPQL
jgi:two-component system sensor histidine kinase and response regulator WspE